MSALWVMPVVLLVATAAALVLVSRRIDAAHAALAEAVESLDQTRHAAEDALAALAAARDRSGPGRSAPDARR